MSVALAHGDVVAQRYRLLAPLGQGGMGVVWRAEHLVLGRPVAVKFVTRGRTNNLRRAQRFLSEAKAVAAVRHPNVVDILDFGVSDEGQPYMVMELLEGASLRERLAARPPISIGLFLDYVDGVLAGLGAVHEAGLVHRDLKPENIFLAEQPSGVVPKLLDFGLTRVVQDNRAAHDAVTLTQEDQILGTPLFMSPEQVRQLEDLDERSDVWSVGVLLYAALTGKLPFDAPKVVDLLFEITRGEVPTPVVALRPEIGAALSVVVARAMERDRAARFATSDDLRTALREARSLSGDVLSAPARALPASLRGSEDSWSVSASSSPSAPPVPEILSLGGGSRDDSAIRERTPPRRRGRQVVAVTVILTVGAAMAGWLWSELLSGDASHPAKPRETTASDALPPAGEQGASPAAKPTEQAPAQGSARHRGVGPASERKPAARKERTDRRGDAPVLFREPDY